MPRGRWAAVALVLVSLTAGCAEKWQKPGASDQDFQAMQAQCVAYANGRWPPALRQTLMFPGHWVPPVRSCDRRGRCVLVGGYYEPPQYMLVDDNQGPRNQERRACYFANGWVPVDD